jgi:hypothetical protein
MKWWTATVLGRTPKGGAHGCFCKLAIWNARNLSLFELFLLDEIVSDHQGRASMRGGSACSDTTDET